MSTGWLANNNPGFPGYSGDVWGITSSDSPRGYVAWGGPPRHTSIDGSVVPVKKRSRCNDPNLINRGITHKPVSLMLGKFNPKS